MPMTGVISGFVTPKDKTKSNLLAKLKVRIFSKNKFFDTGTVKWRPSKIFAKLTGKGILWATFGKFREYESFLLTVVHNFD